MKAYTIEGTHLFVGTLVEAHAEAKRLVKEGDFRDWRDVRIAEVEVQVDKAGVIAALNLEPMIKHTGRVWEFKSQRLGLEETTGLE